MTSAALVLALMALALWWLARRTGDGDGLVRLAALAAALYAVAAGVWVLVGR